MPSDPSTVHIRLLISDDTCPTDECPGIGPERAGGGANTNPSADLVEGTVRLLQDNGPPNDDVIDVDTKNGVARFRLLPNPMPTGKPTTIVALGLDGEGVPLEMARIVLDPVPDRTYEQVELGPINGRVAIWPDDGTYTCVEIDGITDDPKGTEFYVPRTDVDCDRLRNEDDCQPLDYLFAAPQTQAVGTATCASDDKIDGNDGCYLGQGGQCSDGVPAGACSSFNPGATCVPGSFCDGTCAGSLDSSGCVPGTSAQLQCRIVLVNGAICALSAFTPAAQTCNSLAVQTFADSPGIDLSAFGTHAQLRANSGGGDVATVTVVPTAQPDLGCGTDTLQFTEGENGDKGAAWVRLRLDSVDEVVPLIVTFEDAPGDVADCTVAAQAGGVSTCDLVITPGDALETCAK